MSYAYYRFFPGDYLRDTVHLGWIEDCAYRRLIDLYQLHSKPIRNDRAYILRACRAFEPEQQAAVDTVLAEFFTLKADGWHQSRCDAEVRFRQDSSESGKKAALARWSKNKDLHTDALRPQSERNANQNQNQNKPNTLAHSAKPAEARLSKWFSDFWQAYPRKKSKGQAQRAFIKLAPDGDTMTAIMRALPIAVESTDWQRERGKFIPYPATWLNARGWEDEQAPAEQKRFVI